MTQTQRYFHIYQQIAIDDIVQEFEQDKDRRMCPFLRFIKAVPSDSILEIGVGRGLLLNRLCGWRVGIDIALPYLHRFKNSYHQVQSLCEHLPFASSSFDLVVADCVLEHVLDLDAALSEISRVLKPKGKLCAVVPHNENLSKYHWQLDVYGLIEHQRTFSKDSVFHGFTLLRIEEIVYAQLRKAPLLLRVIGVVDAAQYDPPRFLMVELQNEKT